MNEDGESVTITAYADADKDVVIPSDLDKKIVTNIGSRAFYMCRDLECIEIPSSVVNIEGFAFMGCNGLKNVMIHGGVTHIGIQAFMGCGNLEHINLPEGVVEIEGSAFDGCSSLTKLEVDNNNKNYASDDGILYNKDKTMLLCCMGRKTGNAIIPEGITDIKEGAFWGCGSLESISIPKSVTSIGGDAFFGCTGLENLEVDTGIDYTVSYRNNINAGTATVIVTGRGNYEGTAVKTFKITVKKGTYHTLGSYKYQITNASEASVVGMNNVKTTKLKIPKTVKIATQTFRVTAIGKNAFKKNKKITSVVISDNVKTIGASAFAGCTKLGTITIKSTKLKKVGKNALKGIKANAMIKVPAKKLPTYKKLFKNKGQGKKVRITK